MAKAIAAKKQQLVFTIEYTIQIEETMDVNLNSVLDTMRESGGASIVGVEIREG